MNHWLMKSEPDECSIDDALAARGLTVQDVETALRAQNLELPAGYVQSQERDYQLRVARAFETPEQQLGFFAELSPDVQRQMLLEAIDEAEKGPAALDELSAAWERGEIGTLERLLNEDMRTEYPEVYAAHISRRNAAWIAMLTHELQGSGVDFVAVGAAHLVGDEGLVAQLRARGIRVERVGAR